MLRTFLIPLALSLCLLLHAGEGMWLPIFLKSLNEAEMQAMGMKLTAEDIYSVNQGSLKDAIVSFGGFCTGSIISEEGLVLTNHHCGYGSIQRHSSLERNLLRDGFWAATKPDELPNPGLYVTFIIRIEDVTSQVLPSSETSPDQRQSVIDQNINKVITSTLRESYQDAYVRAFFEGNQYFLFVTETYHDVRLVGTPPESIGKFGADTDNWEWPRHTGDFSLFRVYAGTDNKPAAYHPENVPLKPRHALPVSLRGVAEGDFTMVFGFPGRTEQHLTSHAVRQLIEIIDPARIDIRGISLGILDKHMRRDEGLRLMYAPRFASLANSWKKWVGEKQGLEQVNAVQKKQEREEEFLKRIGKKKRLQTDYGNLLPQFEEIYKKTSALEKARIYYGEIFGVNVQLFQLVSRLDRIRNAYINNGEAGFNKMRDQQAGWLTNFYSGFNKTVDREVCHALLMYLTTDLDSTFLAPALKAVDVTTLVDVMYSDALCDQISVDKMLSMSPQNFIEFLERQPAHELYLSVQEKSDNDISAAYNAAISGLNTLKQEWVAALMQVFPEERFWPDANSTMRITYGQVAGYEPRDAVIYAPMTFLDGVMEKYKPGDYEFDVHPRLIELYERGEYGRYADATTGKLPICFLGSNHTTGGNSGSPAIDGSGNLVGLNFDRVWEGTMSDVYYDPSICRNIMVDIRYVMFVVDKFAGASHLIREMELVTP